MPSAPPCIHCPPSPHAPHVTNTTCHGVSSDCALSRDFGDHAQLVYLPTTRDSNPDCGIRHSLTPGCPLARYHRRSGTTRETWREASASGTLGWRGGGRFGRVDSPEQALAVLKAV